MKKGFTLAELLAVVMILGIIAAIIVPTVDSGIKKSKMKAEEVQIKNIKEAAKMWAYDNKEVFYDNDTYEISISKLKKENYLDVEIKNPATDACISNNMKITIEKIPNNYEITLNKLIDGLESDCLTYGNLVWDFKDLDEYLPNVDKLYFDNSGTTINDYIIAKEYDAMHGNTAITYIVNSDVTGKYDMYIVGNGNIYAPAKTTLLFDKFTSLDVLDLKGVSFEYTEDASKTFEKLPVSSLTNLDLSKNKIRNASKMFAKMGLEKTSFTIEGLETFNTSKVVNMSYMFWGTGCRATNLTLSGFASWNTSKVTDMSYMFDEVGYYSTSVSIVGLDDWDTSKVTDMAFMFSTLGFYATTLSIGDLTNWDVSSLRNAAGLFMYLDYSTSTVDIGDISGWDVSNVVNMSTMFAGFGYNATNCNIGDLSSWDVSNVTNFTGMFGFAGRSSTTFSVNLTGWDTSSAVYMGSMFSNAGYSATTWSIGNISGWDTSNVTNMIELLAYAGSNATTINIGNIGSWDVSKNVSLSATFAYFGQHATTFYMGDLSSWDVSNVTKTDYMFASTGSNSTTFNVGDLSKWDTSKFESVEAMFNLAGKNSTTWYIGKIADGWNLSSINGSLDFFLYHAAEKATTVDIGDLDNWTKYSSRFTSLKSIFGGFCSKASVVNFNVGNWDTSNVTNLYRTFAYINNYKFTSVDLSNWDTSKVTDMESMFDGSGYITTIYVGPKWSTASVTSSDRMFYGLSRLVGAVSYSSKHTDASYADTSHYLTLKQS